VAATPFQSNLRSVNDQRRDLFGGSHRLIVFVCECSQRRCIDGVLLSAEDFDARRPGPILADGHDA
jgi:hypothetical protein